MNKTKINLKIITPNGIIEDSNHRSIKLPGLFGIFEILPGHENYLTLLKKGIISIDSKNKFLSYYLISDSLFRFNRKTSLCQIIAEYAIDIFKIANI